LALFRGDGGRPDQPDVRRPGRPIYDYDHGGGRCTVIGGVVVRDPRLPSLAGHYLFGD
jgi:hypothetical protein